MGTPYIGEVKIMAFNFAPKGWALCNGQPMSIQQNQALFSLLGTTYGGNGTTTFNLPNLQGRVPFHMGNSFTWGQVGGETAHTLIISEMPAHTHNAAGNPSTANASNPVGNFWGNSGKNLYNRTPNTNMAPQAISNLGGSQPHDNMSPYLVLNFCIALVGIFPSRN
jgi:microcystin-dependent protein